MGIVKQPAVALGHIGPGADIGEPLGQSINVAIGAVNPADLQGKPIGRDMPKLVQIVVDLRQQSGMFTRRNAAEIGNPANIP